MPIATAVTDADANAAILQIVCMRRVVALGSLDAASHARLKPTLDVMVAQGFMTLDAKSNAYLPAAAGVKMLSAWKVQQATPQRTKDTDATFLVTEIAADTVKANVVGSSIVGR